MNKILTAGAIAALCLSPSLAGAQTKARSGTNSPTATNENPSSCLGASALPATPTAAIAPRRVRPGQSAFVKFLNEAAP
jgi:hypothetical protein